MVVPLAITVDDTHALDMTRATRRSIQKETYRAIGNRWQTKWLPRHFTRRARQIYGYRERSTRWKKKKEALAKRFEDLKLSGEAFFDKIADESTAVSEEEVLEFATKVGHPALEMDPMF